MSKKLTIPKAYGYPTTIVRINGRKETFPTGKEISVSEEVYDIFQHIFAQKPKERTHPDGYVWGVNADGSVSLRPDNTDWNQNDPNAPDYVKNRTHYEVETVVDSVTYAVFKTNSQNLGSSYGSMNIAICAQDNVEMPENVFIRIRVGGHEIIKTEMPPFENNRTGYSETIKLDDSSHITFSLSKYQAHKDPVYSRTDYFYNVRVNTTNSDFLGTDCVIEMVSKEIKKLDKKYLPDDIGGGGATVFYIGDDHRLYHDVETTKSVSKEEYRLAMTNSVIRIETTDGYSVYYPVYTDFGYDYARATLWDDGEWWIVYTSEYAGVPV